ncbi:glycosyltransferase 6-like [Primulina eburnea]|uniref:glycosyltransferase 6-like n=1 Tax=Primulina eburnea TaxID=1245227 RepID=UPI003C6C02C4
MAKSVVQTKRSNLGREMSFGIASATAILMFCAMWIFTDPFPSFSTLFSTPNGKNCTDGEAQILNMSKEITKKTFHDEVGYTMDRPVVDWDEKKREWLKNHPTFGSGVETRVLVLTGSQPTPCKNPVGDYLLLRLFKNKVDYCRIHGYDVFYNNAILNPKMRSFWAKIPVVRAAMVAHPEVEWIFWVDSDAIFTDMEFKVPLERYKDHNLVVHGWPNLIYEKKSWVGLNAGIFLIRNCQWSMDFLRKWASMGPSSPDYKKWGKILRSTLKDKLFPESDDQSALVYLLLKEKKKWGDMIYVENEYFLHGYWREIVGKLDSINEKYEEAERAAPKLRRRHAEAVTESFDAARESLVAAGWRRPFVTHFTGCQPCSGEQNPEYGKNSCRLEMERALNFADNQVLRNYGFRHPNIQDGSTVRPLPFDFPGDESDEFT